MPPPPPAPLTIYDLRNAGPFNPNQHGNRRGPNFRTNVNGIYYISTRGSRKGIMRLVIQ